MHSQYMHKSQIPVLNCCVSNFYGFFIKTVGIEKVDTKANDIVSGNFRSGFSRYLNYFKDIYAFK